MKQTKFIHLEDYRRLDKVIKRLSQTVDQLVCVFEVPEIKSIMATRLQSEDVSVSYSEHEKAPVMLVGPDYMKNMLLHYYKNPNETLDVGDVIMFCNAFDYGVDTEISLQLLGKMVDRGDELPGIRLVSPHNMIQGRLNIPIHDSVLVKHAKSGIPEIMYSMKNMTNQEMITKLFSVVSTKKVGRSLVFCNSTEQCVFLGARLLEFNFNTIILSQAKCCNKTRCCDQERPTIVLTDREYLPIRDIDFVFDLRMSNNKLSVIQRTMLAYSECYRFYTEEHFKSLPTMKHSINNQELHRQEMDLLRLEISPHDIFNYSLINPKHSIMKNRYLVSGDKLTDIGLFVHDTGLSPFSGRLLFHWMEDYPPFPGIVIATMLDTLKTGLLIIPNNDRENHYFMNHGSAVLDDLQPSYMRTYLYVWLRFCDQVGTLKPNMKELEEWCKINKVRFGAMESMLHKMLKVFATIESRTRLNVSLGTFSVNGAISAFEELLEERFGEEVYAFDERKGVYVNKDRHEADLGIRHHYEPNLKRPNQLHPLHVEGDKIRFFHHRN